MFEKLPKHHFGAILADPPWSYWTYGGVNGIPARSKNQSFGVMSYEELSALPIIQLANKDCILFCWVTWPKLPKCLEVISNWGFEYKSCAFDWMKADNSQPNFFEEEIPAQIGMGYWTRANTEPCLLATRGKPKRLNADVRQGIIAPRREHSRKPDGIHERIERLVAGPYLELFARQKRPGWTVWGNQTDKFKPIATSPTSESTIISPVAGT